MTKMPRLRIPVLCSALGLLSLLLAGCFETKDEYTLNADGSGKVVHESTFQEISFSNKDRDLEAALKETIAKVIKESKGVEAWRDVSFKRLDDGRIYFKGTAYFKNLSQLSITNQTMLDFDWAPTDGGGVLTLRDKKSESGLGLSSDKEAKAPASLPPEERAKKIKEDRIKFQQMKPMLAGILGAMKHEVVLHLPGKTSEVANFTEDASGALTIRFDGKKLLDAMDTLVSDDAWMATNSGPLGGEKMPWADAKANQLVFGSRSPVRAVVTGATGAAFDYSAEVATAAADSGALQQQLGATAPVAVAPAQSAKLNAVRIAGVRLVTESDEKRELQPFGSGAGYTVSVLVELPGSVLAINDASGMDTAVADDGSDLLPESEFSRRFSFPKLATDKSAVLLDVELKAPGPTVKGLKELSGHLQYSVAGKIKEIDLGFAKLAENAKGRELGAELKKIQADSKTEGSQLEIRLEVNQTMLRKLYLVSGGKKIELKQNGYSGSDNTFTFTYEVEPAISSRDRIVVEVYDQLQTFDAPFKLENISLLGTPLN
jgi:hypothetical protein